MVINILKISPDRLSIDVSITTNSDDVFTKISFWNENNFKDYTLSKDLSSFIVGTTENEVFTIEASDVGIESFNGIYFLEITSTDNTPEPDCSNCVNPVVAVVADLSIYREILLSKILELNDCEGNIFEGDICSNSNMNNIINTQMLLDSIMASLQFGYYTEALNLLESLKKLVNIDSCNSCNEFQKSTFINGLNYSILNNTLILN